MSKTVRVLFECVVPVWGWEGLDFGKKMLRVQIKLKRAFPHTVGSDYPEAPKSCLYDVRRMGNVWQR